MQQSLIKRLAKSLLNDKGNLKIGDDTIIFNITAAHDCPSDAAGLCNISKECYAKKAELIRPKVLPYRRDQERLWDDITVEDFADVIFDVYCNSKGKKIKYLRINESGDYRTQKDITKLKHIVELLNNKCMEQDIPYIIVYFYTKRIDLDFSTLSSYTNIVINGSGFMLYNNLDIINSIKDYKKKKDTWLCNDDCTICKACMTKGNRTIYVIKH